MTADSDNTLICDNGGAYAPVPTKTGTRKVNFTVEDIPTLVDAPSYFIKQNEEHPNAVYLAYL